MKKPKVFYVEPVGSHTNKVIAELLESRASDSECHQMKVCGARQSINVFRVNVEDLQTIIFSRLDSNLSYELYRNTVDGLVYIVDVEYWTGIASPFIVRGKLETDLHEALERLHRKKPLVNIPSNLRGLQPLHP